MSAVLTKLVERWHIDCRPKDLARVSSGERSLRIEGEWREGKRRDIAAQVERLLDERTQKQLVNSRSVRKL